MLPEATSARLFEGMSQCATLGVVRKGDERTICAATKTPPIGGVAAEP